MTRRLWVLAVTAWLGVVLAGSVLTWLAIDRAGQQVTSSSVLTEITPAPSPVPSPSPTAAKPRPKPKPSPTPRSRPVARPTLPAPTPVAPPPPPVQSVVRTWSGTAGSLTASCTGPTIHFVSASPNTGWQVGRGDISGRSLEVVFSKTGGQVQVEAACVRGAPSFQTDSSGGADN